MTALLNSGSSLLEKMEVFNCLTTFQFTQLTQLKQWSLLHANQAVVPQATPVPGFERLMLLPQITNQDIPASMKPVFESTPNKSFLDDLSEVADLFDGIPDYSMFNLNPEKDIDQVPDRTDFDEFLDEVLSEPSPYVPSAIKDEAYNNNLYSQPNSPLHSHTSINSVIMKDEGCYDLVQSQPNSPIYSTISKNPVVKIDEECYDLVHSQPNSPAHGNPSINPVVMKDEECYDLVHSQPNSPAHSNPSISPVVMKDEECYDLVHSQPNSPLHSHPNSQIHSPPQSPSVSEAGSNACSTDEGIGSQCDGSDLECGDDFLDLSMNSTVMPSLIPEATNHQLLAVVKQESAVFPAKTERRKRGPRPQVKYRGDGPMQLWQFLLELIIAPEYTHLIKWTQDEDYEFKILKPTTVAKMWGEKKNKPTMNYEKLSRGLRYYYGKSVIEKVHGKRYVYQFKCDIPKILGYDPMVTVKCEDYVQGVEDVICGEPVVSPEAEDLLVTSSVEDGLLAFL